jgi:hypothetical protein
MTAAIVAAVALLASGVAAAYPYLPKFSRPSGISPSRRAWWVNRLFALAADAEASGEQPVAAAARALMDALVNPVRKGGR